MKAVSLPSHLSRYIVEQDYSCYTNIDQAVWRFIMRRLKDFLSTHAHECYLDGLAKTGISTEEIPRIDVMSEKLSKFGWKAMAVSGFIPPAAFMELQSLSVLPIACDMRTIEHAMYTPAPDIVHEAAGHAPILIHPEFSKYLHEYAQVAKKAIINKEDLDIYEAIRILSDLKESPDSTESQIAEAEKALEHVSKLATIPSEAALLARMNWWTAEYGLIGDLDNPKIYGAGLLSSYGESASALKEGTKKVPFSLECLDFAYDITEPQPQLFVTPSFEYLTEALNLMSDTMAFKVGGAYGLDLAKKSKTVNTVEFNSGIQISGILKNYIISEKTISSENKYQDILYLQFDGPTQLSLNNVQIENQGTAQHALGFGTPLGKLKNSKKCLSEYADKELKALGLEKERHVELQYESGLLVKGQVRKLLISNNKVILISFSDCLVTLGEQVLFDPSWGTYDMAVGSHVVSVFGGAADREAYGETEDFVAKRVSPPRRTPQFLALNEIYGQIRKIRTTFAYDHKESVEKSMAVVIDRLNKDFPKDWLTRLEILEICVKNSLNPKGLESVQNFIIKGSAENSEEGFSLREGLRLIEKGI